MSDVVEYMQWIPTSKRFPDKEWEEFQRNFEDSSMGVIVMISGAKIPTELFYNGYDFEDAEGDTYSVTHWMSFPPPPDKCIKTVNLGDDLFPNYEMFEAIFLPEV